MTKPEYAGYPIEENIEIYLSSCFFKSSEAYEKFHHYVKAMLRGEDYFVLNTSYELAVHHGLLSKSRAEAMRKEMDSVSWAMEMESLWWGKFLPYILVIIYLNRFNSVKAKFL